ncbi:MAG: rhomboid family intramembrane serine protease [Paludibacteraceae bacterium]
MDFIDNLKRTFKTGNMVIKLIYVNAGVFLLISAFSLIMQLFKLNHIEFTRWFAVPSNLQQLLTHVWTLVTYMFYHERFFHVFFNLLVLFWFGKIFLMYYSEKQLLSLYIFGGLLGAIFYIIAYNLFPYYEAAVYYSLLMGASGSILAILTASAVKAPNMEVQLLLIGRIKLKWIAIVTVLISFFGLTSGNAGGELAHLGGALAGYLFVVGERNGRDITSFINGVIDFFVNLFRSRPKVKKTTYHAPKMSSEEYNQKKAADEKAIDKILDKIKTSGYESLSADEKRKLFEQKR